MDNFIINVDGIFAEFPAENFDQAWDYAKGRFNGATIESVVIMWDGCRRIALVDEDGIGKELLFNPIASAAYNLQMNPDGRQYRLARIYGTMIVCSLANTLDYFKEEDLEDD